MSKLTEYVVIIGVIVMIALSVLNRFSPAEQEGVIPAEVMLKLDSLNDLNTKLAVQKAIYLTENQNLEQEVWDLKNQLADIKPKYIPIFKEYKDAPPEKKKELVKSEYEKRLKEREGDK